MSRIEFEDLTFHEKRDSIICTFYKYYSFNIPKEGLFKDCIVGNCFIEHPSASQKQLEKILNRNIQKGFDNLKNTITGNRTLYIHKNSAIPLIGTLYFGIVDKGTNIIEIKPLTGCNLDCVFCSVDEGSSSKKVLDFLIEEDYLVQECSSLLKYKKKRCEIFINPHGEPLLYSRLASLVKSLKSLPLCAKVTVITNALNLTEKQLDLLIDAGLDCINISMLSLFKDTANRLGGREVNTERIIQLIKNKKNKIKITLTPVLMFKKNEEDIEEMVSFAKKEGIDILIQNFQRNKRGRNPVKTVSTDIFLSHLRLLEKKYDIHLLKYGKLTKTDELNKPFICKDRLKATSFSAGRYSFETLLYAKGRIITAKEVFSKTRSKNIEITQDKHNLFKARIL